MSSFRCNACGAWTRNDETTALVCTTCNAPSPLSAGVFRLMARAWFAPWAPYRTRAEVVNPHPYLLFRSKA